MRISGRQISNDMKRLKSLVRRPALPLYSLEGSYEGSTLRALIADDGSTLRYMQSLLFPDGVDTRCVGRIASALAPRLANADADIVCVGANQFLATLYARQRFRLIPKWIRVYLPVSGHPDEILSKLSGNHGGIMRRSAKKMKDDGFTYDVTNDPAWFDSFYERMYKPYALNRFGELAEVTPYEKLQRDFLRGGGIVIKRNQEPVAGVVVFQRGRTLWFHRIGVKDGDENLIREGASTALYYYAILHAYSSGCTGMDFGHSRPLASDGALRHKLKWGMQVLDEDDGIGAFAIAAPGQTEAAGRFFAANRFYELTGKGIRLRDDG